MKTKAGVVYKESRFKEEARNKGKRQPWQAYEDEQVIDLVNKHGQSWALISSMMEGRTGKQIRDRYLNKLRPDIKNDEWNNEEDQLLISLYHELGRKWSKIATHLPGRTEGQVKNRFYSHISKKLLNSEDLEHTIEVGNTTPPSKLNSKTKNANTSFGQSMSTQACFSKEPKDKFFEEVANLDFNIDFPTSGNKSRFDQILENQEFNIGEPFSIVEFGDPTDVIYDPNFLGSLKKVSPTKRVLDKSNFTFQEENNYQFQQHMNNQNETEQQPFYEELQNDFTKRNISVCFQPETISPTFFGYNQERTTKTSPNQKLMSQIDFGFDFTIPSANYQFEHDFDQVQKKNERNFNTNIQDEIYWTR